MFTTLLLTAVLGQIPCDSPGPVPARDLNYTCTTITATTTGVLKWDGGQSWKGPVDAGGTQIAAGIRNVVPSADFPGGPIVFFAAVVANRGTNSESPYWLFPYPTFGYLPATTSTYTASPWMMQYDVIPSLGGVSHLVIQ